MKSIQTEILPGSTVTLHFSLSLMDGTEAVSTFNEQPLTFQMGDKTFQPTMEMALYGLQVGDEQVLTLTPEQAFGDSDPGLIQAMGFDDFKAIDPEVDQVIAFATPAGEQTMGVVREVHTDRVIVDFNHPMSGREVVFKVKILDVNS